ncbi:pentatricopeptide repeat-containing protein At2g20710, mitochondrial-like [Silene latifolia]|uniref:pentatricopeptide repeat-containing protein At2g20710, mitochondrial-like n=1 Tax=Silene latifolia TaxID=37657 RepID=UPI003D77F3BC
MKLIRLLFTRVAPFRNVSRTPIHNWYSTETTTTTPTVSKRRPRKIELLYRRIAPLGNPNISIVPVLDQWLHEGRTFNLSCMRFIIKELRHYRRYNHALQVSEWMSEKRATLVTAADLAIRLNLMAKVHGIEEVENYFNSTPEEMRTLEVYTALLNCFSQAKCVEKSECVMQKVRELGFTLNTTPYNVMLGLYSQTGDREKLDALLAEMEAKKIKFDNFTYGTLLNAYGNYLDIDRFERILSKMESDPELDIDWMTYTVAAKHYLRAQLLDKALESLRKSEKLVAITKKKNEAYSAILTHYATAGKKEDVLRVWEECKMCKVTNRDYMALMPSVLMFEDVETAEKILKEWESSNLTKDIRVPNFLISTYCARGWTEKAEALLERVKSEKWQPPDAFTWFWMSFVYVKSNQMPKAVKALESALSEFHPNIKWKARQETMIACLKYLKDEGEFERLNALIDSLKDKCLISAKIHENLVEYISGECTIEDVFLGDSVEEVANK